MKLFVWEQELARAFELAWATYKRGGAAWRDLYWWAESVFVDMSVAAGGGRAPYLFTKEDASAKLIHSAESSVTDGWVQAVQYLPQARESGSQFCRWSTRGCRSVCLADSGRLATPAAKIAMRVRSDLMLVNPLAYAAQFIVELDRMDRAAFRKGLRLAARPNGTSDIPWEEILPLPLFQRFHLFDYTKGKRHRRQIDPYFTVASATERDDCENESGNVVFPVNLPRGAALPAMFAGRVVIDGDAHDRRDLDPEIGAAVLVRVKGFRRESFGFIREVVQA